MSIEAATITLVRTRVRDAADPYTYEDEVYEGAGEYALQKLSYDFGTTYSSDTSVPSARRFLLAKLMTIELAYIRAADSAESGDSATVSVPDLSVSGGGTVGADFWMKLAGDLQAEYDGELSTGEGAGEAHEATVEVVTVQRTSRRTGTLSNYIAAVDPDAPADFTAVVKSSAVWLTWTPGHDQHFAWYELYRSADEDALEYPATSQRVTVLSDIKGVWTGGIVAPRIIDSPGVGTWYYRMAAVNDVGLRAFTPIASAEVE